MSRPMNPPTLAEWEELLGVPPGPDPDDDSVRVVHDRAASRNMIEKLVTPRDPFDVLDELESEVAGFRADVKRLIEFLDRKTVAQQVVEEFRLELAAKPNPA